MGQRLINIKIENDSDRKRVRVFFLRDGKSVARKTMVTSEDYLEEETFQDIFSKEKIVRNFIT